jgi:hypothetical protein
MFKNMQITNLSSIPSGVIEAVMAVENYFMSQGVSEWKIGGIQSRTDQPTFADALRIANGCRQDADNASDHWRLGINSVITALERAYKHGLNDPQVAALWNMGGEK